MITDRFVYFRLLRYAAPHQSTQQGLCPVEDTMHQFRRFFRLKAIRNQRTDRTDRTSEDYLEGGAMLADVDSRAALQKAIRMCAGRDPSGLA